MAGQTGVLGKPAGKPKGKESGKEAGKAVGEAVGMAVGKAVGKSVRQTSGNCLAPGERPKGGWLTGNHQSPHGLIHRSLVAARESFVCSWSKCEAIRWVRYYHKSGKVVHPWAKRLFA